MYFQPYSNPALSPHPQIPISNSFIDNFQQSFKEQKMFVLNKHSNLFKKFFKSPQIIIRLLYFCYQNQIHTRVMKTVH